MWALPGGIPNADESLADAASRKLREETGVSDVYLEQLFTFDGLDGDAASGCGGLLRAGRLSQRAPAGASRTGSRNGSRWMSCRSWHSTT